MPFRYQCFECDAVIMSEEPVMYCPECAKLGTVKLSGDLEDMERLATVCVHCTGHIEREDDRKHKVYFEAGLVEWKMSGYNPGRSDLVPKICRRCYWGH